MADPFAMPITDPPDEIAIALNRGAWPLVPLDQKGRPEDWRAARRAWLLEVLEDCERRDVRGFDCDAARAAFAGLPGLVRIYRGTVAAEPDERVGVHWTIDREAAVFYAFDGDSWPGCWRPRRPLPGEQTTWHSRTARVGKYVQTAYVADVCERLRPTLLSCVVRRNDFRLLVFRMGLMEVIVHPRHLVQVKREYVSAPCEPPRRFSDVANFQ